MSKNHPILRTNCTENGDEGGRGSLPTYFMRAPYVTSLARETTFAGPLLLLVTSEILSHLELRNYTTLSNCIVVGWQQLSFFITVLLMQCMIV